MSVTLARLRKRAAEFEQKKLLDKALDVYIQILDEGGKDLGDEDVPLFNRVGDMLMRKGSVTEALGYYERAVDMYAERGFLNNAIALCSKILRQSPGRAAVYYKLGRISARKGFKSDARKNFLEYADRMQKAGQADEAFRALKEFASLYPDQDDVRLILAELLSKENRKGEALEQLQSLYQKLQAEGRRAEARATIDRMRAIDPSVTPQSGGSQPPAGAGDLVFLDLSDDEPRTLRAATPAAPPVSARAPEAPSVPALTGLAVTFLPDELEPDRPDGFEATSMQPLESGEAPPAPSAPTPAVVDAVVDLEPTSALAAEPPDEEPELLPDLVQNESGPARDLELLDEDIPLLDDLEPTAEQPTPAPTDIVGPLRDQPPLSGSEFAGIELAEVPRIEALSRDHDLALPGQLPGTPEEVTTVPAALPASEAAADDARVAAAEAADLVADVEARQAWQGGGLVAPEAPGAAFGDALAGMEDEDEDEVKEATEDTEELFFGAADLDAETIEEEPGMTAAVRDDFLAAPPSFGESGAPVDHAFPPLFGLEDATGRTRADATPVEELAPEPAATARFAIHTPRSTISIGSAEAHLRRRLELEPENWGLRRLLGEALLDTGDRDGGLYELELAMVGFELESDLDRAQEVVDEILGVFPGSVRHHQKRVEYAVRSRDRARLAHSYLELADALFRTGAGDKAVAVYARVLELDTTNERAEFALATLAPDELVRLRGVSARPDRWTDELDAIDGTVLDRPVSMSAVAEEPAVDEGLETGGEPAVPGPELEGEVPDEDTEVAASAESNGVHPSAEPAGDVAGFPVDDEAAWPEPVATPEPEPARVGWEADAGEEREAWRGTSPGDAGEMPPGEFHDGDEAVGAEATVTEPEPLPAEPEMSTVVPASPATIVHEHAAQPDVSDAEAEPASDEPASIPGHQEPGPESLPEEPEPVAIAATEAEPVVPVSEDLQAVVNAGAGEPLAPSEESVALDSSAEPELEAAVGEPEPIAFRADVQPEAARPEQAAASPRAPTPRFAAVPDETSRIERARSLTPAPGSDADFVDLGEWLRNTEPARSTRMLVEDPKPTGDEQADFEELLRRFKRGVAENVEAEDYEAHYDLGVAFKEMGLVDEAIAQFQKALRGSTHRVRSYEALGQCFVEKEQYPIAAALLKRATEVPGSDDQQLVGVLYLLGFATERMGHPAEALPYYLRVFAVDIEFRDVAARVAAMGNLTT